MTDAANIINIQGVEFAEVPAKQLPKISYEEIKFVAAASAGAMGRPNTVFFLTNRNKGYFFKPDEDIPTRVMQFESFIAYVMPDCNTEEKQALLKDWRFMNMGVGNILYIRKELLAEFKQRLDAAGVATLPLLYSSWADTAMKLLQENIRCETGEI